MNMTLNCDGKVGWEGINWVNQLNLEILICCKGKHIVVDSTGSTYLTVMEIRKSKNGID